MIVAEDITSRFLNVVSLFNSSIPLVAIQMSAFRIEGGVALVFNTVLDELSRGLEDDDDGEQDATDRGYWESRASKDTLGMTDQVFGVLRGWEPKLELKYNKFYIGLARDGAPDNFVSFRPKRAFLRVEARLPASEEMDNQLEEAGLDVMPYNKRSGRYRLRLTKSDWAKHEKLVVDLLKQAYERRAS